MNGIIRKTLSTILVLIILAGTCLSLSANAEQTSLYNDEGGMNLDVVFVLDASGSMLYSDPNKIAIDAFNLFVDLCDESCGVGYSVYTQKIIASGSIVSLSNDKDLENLKENISAVDYDPYGFTNIGLGLEEAMKIHSENESSDTDRKKAIILLSDGNTYLSDGQKTTEEYYEELEKTLQSLDSENIPVYSIGLNYDGTLDKEELEKISKGTNGKSYETDTSDELISIISDIFSDIYKLDGTNREIKDGNVEIPVKDNSVFYVNVIVKTNLGMEDLNPVLTSPDGNEVSLTDNDNVKMTSAKSYTLIKLIYPDIGTWNLHLDNADESNCTVTQLDFYSIYIKQSVKGNAVAGETIKIEASLNDGNSVVNDEDLLKTITMTAVVSNRNGDTEIALTRESNGIYTGEFTADIVGDYTVKTIAKSETFQKESDISNITVKINADSISKTEDTDDGNMDTMTIVIIIIGIVVVVGIIISMVVVIIHVNLKRKMLDMKKTTDNFKELPKKDPPKPLPPEKPLNIPKPTDPDYVDIPLVEHGDLESLIKKGPDDAFNTKTEDYQVDPSLEALIKKGADDPFKTNADDYQIDPSLAALIKSGEEGLGNKISLEKDNTPKDDDLQ